MSRHTHKQLRRVYVWELPVRFFHWINALCIVVLIGTGVIISNPPAIQSASEASYSYWFGINRFIHFAFAYIMIFNYVVRVYWAFVGNRYAKWDTFIPTNKKFFKEMWRVLKVDIMLMKGKEDVAVGHNPLSGLTYFIIFLAFIAQVITGFGLYASMSDWWLPNLFAWVPGVIGNDFVLREIHHAIMWVFILFTMIHIYLVLYHEYVEGRGEVSSIVGGNVFLEEELYDQKLKEEEIEAEPRP